MKASPWWKNTTIYQIYPRSFFDSNGDGIGDLRGIILKLDYLQDLGIETLWLSPFFSSPQKDFGYDISDYLKIAPEYGDIETVLTLISEVHKRGMKIVFDLVLNHSSNKHPWFIESSSSTENAKSDWYIWTKKPNNWRSMTGGSAWQYCAARKEYYLASFLPFQADFNYRNAELKKEILAILHYWLQKGVDGFRLDIFNVIYKDAALRDNPFSWQLFPSEENPFGFFQEAKFNLNQKETINFAKELHALCSGYGDRLLLGEVTGNLQTTRKFLGEKGAEGLGLIFNFEMLRFKFTAQYFTALIERMEAHFQEPFTPTYVFSNHDRRRSATRLKGNLEKMKLLLFFQLTVRGVPCLYYGEELGMDDLKLPYETALDPIPHRNKWLKRWMTELVDETINRDDLRTPMQWADGLAAGFSSSKSTWLPAHPNFTLVNVKKAENDNRSLLVLAKNLLHLRKKSSCLQEGKLTLLNRKEQNSLLVFERSSEGESFIVALNFSSSLSDKIDLKGELVFELGDSSLEGISAFGALILRKI